MPLFFNTFKRIQNWILKLFPEQSGNDIVKIRPALYSPNFQTGLYFQIIARKGYEAHVIAEGGEHGGTVGLDQGRIIIDKFLL